jgi:hypothetical protein
VHCVLAGLLQEAWALVQLAFALGVVVDWRSTNRVMVPSSALLNSNKKIQQ